MINVPNIIIGSAILLIGRRLFWLFVGCMGFWVGYTFVERFIGPQSAIIVMGVGILTGVAGAFCAIFFQQIAVGLAGFLAGGFLTLRIVEISGYANYGMLWLVCLVGGVLGTVLLVFVFDWALIFLSSLIGAALVVDAIPMAPDIRIWLYPALIVLGFAVQAKLMSAGRSRNKEWRPRARR